MQVYEKQLQKEDLEALFTNWRYEGLQLLNFVEATADLLLEGKLGVLNSEQQEWLDRIRRHGMRAAAHWNSCQEYLRIKYGTHVIKWEQIDLASVVAIALSHLEPYFVAEQLSVHLPNDLPPIRGDYSFLPIAFSYLIYPDLTNSPTESSSVVIETTLEEKDITVRISRQADWWETRQSNKLLSRTRPCTAKMIIQQHGSELQATVSDQVVEFQFALPIWDKSLSPSGAG